MNESRLDLPQTDRLVLTEECWRCGADLADPTYIVVADHLRSLCPECSAVQADRVNPPHLPDFSAN